MKVETCISISEELLKEIDDCTDENYSRAEFVEEALQKHLKQVKWRKKHRMSAEDEIEKINRYAEENREEIEENLRFQAKIILESLNGKNEAR
jgi:metal-responsive CopG/Arc/MetJ family transcriptional regulator